MLDASEHRQDYTILLDARYRYVHRSSPELLSRYGRGNLAGTSQKGRCFIRSTSTLLVPNRVVTQVPQTPLRASLERLHKYNGSKFAACLDVVRHPACM
jgi:hypothetical protein